MPSQPADRHWSVLPGEVLSAISAVLLLVFMFGFQWYGVDGLPGHGPPSALSTTENAWHGLTAVRWVMLLTIAVAIGAPLLHITGRAVAGRLDAVAIAALGLVCAALLIYRVLIDLPSSDQVVDQKLGAFLGVSSAIGIAAGGFEAVRGPRSGSKALEAGNP
jgi:hypothetical protein